jgi:hypothetical protein
VLHDEEEEEAPPDLRAAGKPGVRSMERDGGERRRETQRETETESRGRDGEEARGGADVGHGGLIRADDVGLDAEGARRELGRGRLPASEKGC